MQERKLKKTESADAENDKGKKKRYRRNAFRLSTSDLEFDGEPRDGDTRKRDLVMRLRELLRGNS